MSAKEKTKKTEKYLAAVGRRKSAIARVFIFEGHKNKGKITVNDKDLAEFLPLKELQKLVKTPLKETKTEKTFYISVKVKGGGIKTQAEAIRLAISRALLKFKQGFRPILKPLGFLTCDARVKERRKFGLKKARKAPQWSKR